METFKRSFKISVKNTNSVTANPMIMPPAIVTAHQNLYRGAQALHHQECGQDSGHCQWKLRGMRYLVIDIPGDHNRVRLLFRSFFHDLSKYVLILRDLRAPK